MKRRKKVYPFPGQRRTEFAEFTEPDDLLAPPDGAYRTTMINSFFPDTPDAPEPDNEDGHLS